MRSSPSRIPTRSIKGGRPKGRFTQHQRLDKLKTVLEGHPGGLALAELAAMLRVTHRSVLRYLRYLQSRDPDQLESIETMPGGAHLWRIKPSERGRTIALRRTQAYGLLSTRRVFDVMKGSAFYDELDVALREVQKLAQRPARPGEIPSNQRLEQRLLYLPPAPRNYRQRGEELDVLFQSVAELRTLTFRVRGVGGARPLPITLHPYAMVLHKGAIVVVGMNVTAKEVQCFPFDRMLDTARGSDRFTLPDGFDVGQFLQGEFGVCRASRTWALVEFDARVADDIRARKFHPAQKLATSADGRVRLSIPLGDRAAVLAWVMSYGDAARVIEPPELVHEAGEALERAASRYR